MIENKVVRILTLVLSVGIRHGYDRHNHKLLTGAKKEKGNDAFDSRHNKELELKRLNHLFITFVLSLVDVGLPTITTKVRILTTLFSIILIFPLRMNNTCAIFLSEHAVTTPPQPHVLPLTPPLFSWTFSTLHRRTPCPPPSATSQRPSPNATILASLIMSSTLTLLRKGSSI